MPPVLGVIAAVAGVASGIVSGTAAIILGVVSVAASIGASLLNKPKTPPVSQENVNRLRANVDVRTPRKTVIGTTALATDIRDEEFTGSNQDYMHRFIVCASHKVNAINEIWFDDKIAWTLAGGVQGEFVGYLDVATVLEGSAGSAINISARMGTTRRYTGCAYVHLKYKLTGNDSKVDSPFAQAVTTRITIRGEGAALYDPRLDSTVAGGSGSHRADDQSTWVWDADACNNPALALLFYLLGYKINGLLAVGKGIPKERIDLESFAVAANICDESVTKTGGGTEARYRCAGVWSEGDNPTTVLEMLKSSMNADLDDVDGKLRLTIFTDDGFSSDADFTDDDLIGPFEWQQSRPLDESFNVVRGTYTDPSDTALYQQVDFPQVESTSLDGIDRIFTLDLPMVESVGQCQRLGALRLNRETYSGTFKAEFQATAWRVQKNSIVRLTFTPLGWTNKTFRVAEMELRVDGVVPLTLVEEDPDIYVAPALVYGVDGTDSTPYDPSKNPIIAALLESVTDLFNARNDRNATAVVIPTVPGGGAAIDHTLRPDGLCDLSFEWAWSGSEVDIDGFEVSLYGDSVGATYTPGTTPGLETRRIVSPSDRAIIWRGIPLTQYLTPAVRAFRWVDPDINAAGIMRTGWVKSFVSAENPYRPSFMEAYLGDVQGTIDLADAADVADATVNFNTRNDRNATTPTAPTIPGGGAAIDHTLNDDGSADISFEWSYAGSEPDIDGFEIMIRFSGSASAYTAGTTAAEETVTTVAPNKRVLFLHGVNPTNYYTFAVRAVRLVDPDVDSNGRKTSAWVQSAVSGENPYQPSANAAFLGDLVGTIDGRDAADVSDTVKSGGGVADDKVDTPALVANSVSYAVPIALGSTVTGNGSEQTVLTGSIDMDFDGHIMALVTAKQDYTSGTTTWSARLMIDGVEVTGTSGGDGYTDSLAMSGCAAVSAGTGIDVDFKWTQSSSVNIPSGKATMIIWRRYTA